MLIANIYQSWKFRVFRSQTPQIHPQTPSHWLSTKGSYLHLCALLSLSVKWGIITLVPTHRLLEEPNELSYPMFNSDPNLIS